MRELDKLEARLERGVQLQDQKIIDNVHSAAADLEQELPRGLKTLFRDGSRSRARKLKEAAARRGTRIPASAQLSRFRLRGIDLAPQQLHRLKAKTEPYRVNLDAVALNVELQYGLASRRPPLGAKHVGAL